MASLSESSLLNDIMNPKEPKKQKEPKSPKKNDWYNRVYLCWEDTDFRQPTTFSPIKGFKCYRFNSFKSANYAWDVEINCNNELGELRYTMIPMCKWVPQRVDKVILNWKLIGIYWLGNHSFGRGSNKFD